jgi:hypothetical protein
VDRLRPLAYIDAIEGAKDLPSGLPTSDPARVPVGFTCENNAHGCSSDSIATDAKARCLRCEFSSVD